MENSLIQNAIEKPLFTPRYLNIEYLFSEIHKYIQILYNYLTNSETWLIVGLVSGVLSVFCITVIIYTLVRVYELRVDEKENIEKQIQKCAVCLKNKDCLYKRKGDICGNNTI